MRKNRLAVAILLVMAMLLGIMTTAFAADYTPVDPDDQGKTGIVGGDTLTFTEDTVWANLTARWGVRVIFQDGDEWDNAELKSELIPVTDSAAGNTTAPDDPSHEGWKFIRWERVDTNKGTSTLNDNGSVTGINGPGPIIYQAVYELVPHKTGGLTISKTVTGTAGEKDKQFTFTVTIGAEGTYNYTGSKSGTITSGGTVQLKHGESITISGIPEGTSYTVVESDNSGYEVTKAGDTGTIAADTTATASFTNKKDAAPGTPPDKPGDPGISKTGDDNNIALWISLFLTSFIGMMSGIVLFGKKRVGKHMRTFMMLLLVGVMAFSGFGATNAFAAEDGTTGYTYGQYDMTYLPGTTDIVTNMPANETGLTPGSANPYTVPSTVPVREGFEFIDWELAWGTMEQSETYTVTYVVNDDPTYGAPEGSAAPVDENSPYEYMAQVTVKDNLTTTQTYAMVDGKQVPGKWTFTPWDKEDFQITEDTMITGSWHFAPYTYYTVEYLSINTLEPVAPDKVVVDLEVGTTVTETAIPVADYIALEPKKMTLKLAESGNEIIFYYEESFIDY